MNEMTVFSHEQFGQVRTLNQNGEPWFVAADVCRVLNLGNSRQALTRLDDDEKGVISTDTLGGKQVMSVVNEPGLYALVLGSHKKEARAFKRWITHEVLPSIRKTGGYGELTGAMQKQTLLLEQLAEGTRAWAARQDALEERIGAMEATLREAERQAALMEGERPKRRRLKPPISIIGLLEPELKQVVEDMLLCGKYTYVDIVRIMRDKYGIAVSKSSVARYAGHLYLESVEP